MRIERSNNTNYMKLTGDAFGGDDVNSQIVLTKKFPHQRCHKLQLYLEHGYRIRTDWRSELELSSADITLIHYS